MILDAHQHFWQLDRGDYGFPRKDDALLYRDFLPPRLAPHLATTGVTATLAVQATETVAETAFLLDLARQTPFIAGVVGWCDLASGAAVRPVLDRLRGQGPLVGLRPMLQARADADWLLQEAARPALQAMVDLGLTFDALVDVRHLAVIDRLATAFPGLRLVVDHFGKPWAHPDRLSEWQAGLQRLASHRNCWVKISGLPAVSAPDLPHQNPAWLVDVAIGGFGPDRVIWGSDWPVSTRHRSYADSLAIIAAQIRPEARDRVFGSNAARAYGLTGDPVNGSSTRKGPGT